MKKWMYIVIGVVVVVGVILAVRLAPERSPVENGIPDGVSSVPDNDVPDNGVADIGVPDIATATSLHFSVEWTNDETVEWTYMSKNMGTEDMKLRWEGTVDGTEEGFIINGELRKIWSLQDGVWVDEGIEDEYWDMFWGTWTTPFEGYVDELYDWTQGDWSYTEPATGYSVRIYNIQVNPDLSDALFEP
jgi:hypothetical protein